MGVGFQVAPNGMRVLAALGLHQSIQQRGAVSTGMRFVNADGTILTDIEHQREEDWEYPAVNLARESLIEELVEACQREEIPIHYQKKLNRIETVTTAPKVFFDDNTSDTGDLIIGADGIHSVVRTGLFPEAPQPEDTGLIAFGGFMESTHLDQSLLPTKQLMMTFGKKSGVFGIGKSHERQDSHQSIMWWSTLPNPGKTPAELAAMSVEDARAFLLEFYKGWPGGIEDILRAFPDTIRVQICDIPHLPSWTKGKAVLVGDAAHAVSPHSGQGVSMALEDAMCLASIFEKHKTHSVEENFRQFQLARQARVEKIVDSGRRSAGYKGELSSLGSWLRDQFFYWLMPSVLRMASKELYSYKIDWPQSEAKPITYQYSSHQTFEAPVERRQDQSRGLK